MLLAGDVGGTKTTLALISKGKGIRAPVAKATFPSDQYPDLESIIEVFLASHPATIERMSIGVAGPVVAEEAQITNLPWHIRAAALRERFSVTYAHLLNDLEAVGYAIPALKSEDIVTLNAGNPVAEAAIAIVAPGTGLGEGYMTWDGQRYRPHASEGGHTDFGPLTSLQTELLLYLAARLDHVSYERVCSGTGIPNIYVFLKEAKQIPEPDWLREKLAATADQVPIVSQAALAPDAPEICRLTMELFAEILAQESANLALKVLSLGGVYLGGGIPPRILPILQSEAFMSAFKRKGRFNHLLSQMPIHVILNSEAGLLGASQEGLID